MRGFISACLASVLVPISTLSAQESPTIEPGARVRVTAPDCGMRGQKSTVQALRGGTLVLVTTECPLASVTRLDVSGGEQSSIGRGALIGGVVGCVGGAVAGYFVGSICYSNSSEGANCRAGTTAGGAGVGLAVGAGIGALIGAFIKTDRWEEVPLDRLRVSFAPKRHGGFALGLRIAF